MSKSKPEDGTLAEVQEVAKQEADKCLKKNPIKGTNDLVLRLNDYLRDALNRAVKIAEWSRNNDPKAEVFIKGHGYFSTLEIFCDFIPLKEYLARVESLHQQLSNFHIIWPTDKDFSFGCSRSMSAFHTAMVFSNIILETALSAWSSLKEKHPDIDYLTLKYDPPDPLLIDWMITTHRYLRDEILPSPTEWSKQQIRQDYDSMLSQIYREGKEALESIQKVIDEDFPRFAEIPGTPTEVKFFPSKVLDYHSEPVPEEDARRLSQSPDLIKDFQKKAAFALQRCREDTGGKTAANRLARDTILALEEAIKFLQQIRCHAPDETFLDEVFIPFLNLHELMGEIRSWRDKCSDWSQEVKVYPFSQFSKDSALDTAIAFAEEIYNSAKKAARQQEMVNEQDVFDSLTVRNIVLDVLNVRGKPVPKYALGGKPQRRFIDWQSTVKESLDRVSLDHVEQERPKLIDMINNELVNIISKEEEITSQTADLGGQKKNSKKRKKRGRPSDTDKKADEQIFIAWESGEYKTYADLAKEKGISEKDVRYAIDRYKKRLKR